jgi:molybdenum cofactor cytidylyltransferase
MGRPKLLLPFGDTTVAGALLASLREAGVTRTVVVVAPADDALRACAVGAGAAVTVNPDPARGMLSSILAGLEALGGALALEAAGELLLVTPADLPSIRPSTIVLLLEALRREEASLAVPAYRGKRGHPLAIAPAVVGELERLDPAIGLHQLLDRCPLIELAVEDPGVVFDVDTPAQYERLRSISTTDR